MFTLVLIADCNIGFGHMVDNGHHEQWTSRAAHFTVSNERLVLKKVDICQEHLRTYSAADTRRESAVIDIQ